MIRGLLSRRRISTKVFESAVLIAMAGRIIQSFTGLGTLYFIIRYLTPLQQGYYQTFLSLVALQSFLELGILIAVVSVVSHEWAGLTRDPIVGVRGDRQKVARLASAARFVIFWFGAAALLFLLVGGGAGCGILMQRGNPTIWLAPWLAVISFAALTFWTQGVIAFLEGCNEVKSVAAYRLTLGLVSACSMWIAVASGAGLWALPVQLAANLLCSALFIGRWYGRFFWALTRRRQPSSFNWREDIWPMQWPLALQGITSYFYFSLFVPTLFTFSGPIEAGRLGLSLQVNTAMLSVAAALMTVRLPQLGTRFASGDYVGFDALWRRTALLSSALAALGALGVSASIWIASCLHIAFAARFVAPQAFALLLTWGVGLNAMQSAAAYWRAQRQELLGWWGAVPGLATGVAVWALGQRYGSFGAIVGAILVFLTVTAPAGLYFFRQAQRQLRLKMLHCDQMRVEGYNG